MSDKLYGGYSNTHPTDRFDRNLSIDKRFVIDWLSFTFDDLIYDKMYYKNSNVPYYELTYCEQNDFILNSLLKIFDVYKTEKNISYSSWKQLEIIDKSINGYQSSIFIGEHIRINLAGAYTSNNVPSSQILMSGQACREFEQYFGGDWYQLFIFLTKQHEELNGRKLSGSFKRIDIAIDDFTGKELNPYDLEYYAKKGHWVGMYKTLSVFDNVSFNCGDIISKGYSLTFGASGSNQLQIYDKKLERKSKNLEYTESDVWFRYEMRFVDPKADQVVDEYLIHYINDNLNEFAFGLLNACIEFKVESKAINKSELDTLPSWAKFINHVKKIKFHAVPSKQTIQTTTDWFDDKIAKVLGKFYLAYGDEFLDKRIFENIDDSVKRLTKKDKVQINRYLQSIGKPLLTDHDFKKLEKKGIN